MSATGIGHRPPPANSPDFDSSQLSQAEPFSQGGQDGNRMATKPELVTLFAAVPVTDEMLPKSRHGSPGENPCIGAIVGQASTWPSPGSQTYSTFQWNFSLGAG